MPRWTCPWTAGTLWQRIFSAKGFTAISHYFVMDWASVWLDIAGGLMIAGALAAWVPKEFWQAFFLVGSPDASAAVGSDRRPAGRHHLVRSVGNIPSRLYVERRHQFRWRNRVHLRRSIVLPVLNIYRKYYGWRMAAFLLVTIYLAMAVAALLVEAVFEHSISSRNSTTQSSRNLQSVGITPPGSTSRSSCLQPG